jgi:hypothetical protein
MHSQKHTITVLMNDGTWHEIKATFIAENGGLNAIIDKGEYKTYVPCKLVDQTIENTVYREVSIYPTEE